MTRFEHLIADYQGKVSEKDLTHLQEILKLHDLAKDPQAGDYDHFYLRSKANYKYRCLHHHTFNLALIRESVVYSGLTVLAASLIPPYNLLVLARKDAKIKR